MPRTTRRGLYVSLLNNLALGYATILGNRTAEDALITFLIREQIDSLSMYDLDRTLSNMPQGSGILASFMEALRACGVVEINAIGTSQARE